MAKKSVKKTVKKQALVKKGKSSSKVVSSKKPVKKEKSEKDKLISQANLIANSEKKRKAKKTKTKKVASSDINLLEAVIEGLQDRKAKSITVLDLRKLENRVADYFVICDAESKIHVGSIADGMEEYVIKNTGERPYHTEGEQNKEWILIDYVDIVVHVFQVEFREYYNVEGLWGDAKIKRID
ncbi:MAG: ribosome silencing factor [Bacteroidia bacterium]